ncbi:hypothetical protein ACRAWF_28735 [Streptomyces sp. L7]
MHRYAARRLGPEVAEDADGRETVHHRVHSSASATTRNWPTPRPWTVRHRDQPRGPAPASRGPAAEGDRPAAVGRPRRRRRGRGVADRVASAGQSATEAVRGELASGMARLPARHRDVLLLVAWADLG